MLTVNKEWNSDDNNNNTNCKTDKPTKKSEQSIWINFLSREIDKRKSTR